MNKPRLRRNIVVLLWVSALYGLAIGTYELALPLYLRSHGFTAMAGSLVFAVPVAATIILRLCVGRISDRLGRKLFYSLSLLGSAISTLLTPFFPHIIPQIALKSVRDGSGAVRLAMQTVFLYEAAKTKFLALIGKLNGVQLFFHSLGLVIVGYGLGWVLPGAWSGSAEGEGYLPVLIFSGLAALLAFALLAWGLREKFPARQTKSVPFLKELISLKLDPRLYVLMLSMLIFNIGLGTTHSYIMYQFWLDKFSVGRVGAGWIMAVHRFSFAVPLFFAGSIVRGPLYRHRRLAMIVFVCLEGIVIAAAGMIPILYLALAVWLLHDLAGAGLWQPIRDSLLQRYCRGQVRGTDTAKAFALAQVGYVCGAVLGGWCYTSQAGDFLRSALPLIGGQGPCYGLAFLVGGAINVLSTIPLFALLLIDPEERGEATYATG